MVLGILTDVMNFSIYQIFKFRRTQTCQHCQLSALWENSTSISLNVLNASTFEFCIYISAINSILKLKLPCISYIYHNFILAI